MVTPEMLSYISAQTAAGKTKDQIKLSLIQGGGWKSEDIDEAFAHLDHPIPMKKEHKHHRGLTFVAILVLIIGAVYFVMSRFNIHSPQDAVNLIQNAPQQ